MLCLECLSLKFTILYSLNRHRLAKCQTNFADAGQSALVESSNQGLQCLPYYYTNLLRLESLLKLTLPNLPNRYVLANVLTTFADAGQAALVESSDQGLQCLPYYYTNLLRLESLLKLTLPNLPNRYVLANFLTNFADAGQAALVESSDQGLQCLPIY